MAAIRGNICSNEIFVRRVKDANESLKRNAKTKLGNDYDIELPEKVCPQFRVFGMSNNTADEISRLYVCAKS